MHELATGPDRVGVAPEPPSARREPAISRRSPADGRYVAFASQSALVADDTNLRRRRVRARSGVGDDESRVGRLDGGQAEHGRRGSEDPAISADGRYVAFTSDARDLVAGIDRFDVQVYVRDRTDGTTTLASVNAAGDEAVGDDSLAPSISADGRYVAFHSGANNLYPGHVFDTIDVVVRDTAEAGPRRSRSDARAATTASPRR